MTFKIDGLSGSIAILLVTLLLAAVSLDLARALKAGATPAEAAPGTASGTAMPAGSSTQTSTGGSMPVIEKNEVILPKGPGEYMEVRHIVLRGTNAEIGEALGDIGQEHYGAQLERYASPLYGRAREAYMAANYPVLLERMKGVAKSYGIAQGDYNYDTGGLPYGLGPAGCSIVFFPGNSTSDGHAMYSRNMDYFTASMPEILGIGQGGDPMLSENYVLEMYPDKGYPSIAIGSFDLMQGSQDGMNSEGLTISLLVDNDLSPAVVNDPSRVSGLSMMQLMRLLLDNASTTEGAKALILSNEVFMPLVPLHALVADRSGSSFIAELSAKDFQWHFTDNAGKPQILTNHAVYKYPDYSKFPNVSENDTYDSFNRYRRLGAYVSGHEGKFTPDDATAAVGLVYATGELAMEGGSRGLPIRTMWTSALDLENRSVWVRFYLKDGPKDAATNAPTLVFSKPFTFRLNASSAR